MTNKIVLDTNLKSYEVEFKDRGITTEIRFNPADPDLAVRFSELQDRVSEGLKDLSDIELDENGRAKDMSFVENIKKVDALIRGELDRAFGNEISEIVFQFCSPMASVNGKYFIVQFIEAVSPFIEKSIEDENKALKKHLAKYNRK